MDSYKSGDYTSTKNGLQLLLTVNKTNDTLNYFYGVVNYELCNFAASANAFNTVGSGSSFYQKAQYRLILIDLKANNKKAALQKINDCLLSKEHLYYDKLSKLKSELAK